MQLLREKGLEDIIVFAGGIIPEEDIPALEEMGIRAVFGPGTPTHAVIDFIRQETGGEGEGETG